MAQRRASRRVMTPRAWQPDPGSASSVLDENRLISPQPRAPATARRPVRPACAPRGTAGEPVRGTAPEMAPRVWAGRWAGRGTRHHPVCGADDGRLGPDRGRRRRRTANMPQARFARASADGWGATEASAIIVAIHIEIVTNALACRVYRLAGSATVRGQPYGDTRGHGSAQARRPWLAMRASPRRWPPELRTARRSGACGVAACRHSQTPRWPYAAPAVGSRPPVGRDGRSSNRSSNSCQSVRSAARSPGVSRPNCERISCR